MEPILGLERAQQQIKEVVGGKVYPVYTFMLYIFLHIFFLSKVKVSNPFGFLIN